MERLANVCEMYYLARKTQQEIADKTGYSRSMISRLLTEATELGIVEIKIKHPLQRNYELEAQLEKRYGLKMARVVAVSNGRGRDKARHVGKAAARVIEQLVSDHSVVGVSWGTALAETFAELRPQSRRDVTVVQVMGSFGNREPEIDGAALSSQLAHAFGGKYIPMPAPLYVRTPTMRDALLQDQSVAKAIETLARANILIAGIGAVDPKYSTLLRTQYITPAYISQLKKRGAAGDICALNFDTDGKIIETPLSNKRVGISIAQMLNIPTRVGIAGGEHKRDAIAAALANELVNVIVTDEPTAVGILQS